MLRLRWVLVLCLASSVTWAAEAPRKSTMTTRLRCVGLAAAVGPLAAAPGLVPLWVAGASKGLAVSNVVTDAIARSKTASGQDPTRTRVQWEKDNLWFISGMALLGSVLASALLWPGFTILVTSALVLLTFSSDGLFSGLCRNPPTEARPAAHKVQTAALGLGLLGLSLLPLPLVVIPTLAGGLLVMISVGLLPAFPLIPALGFVDLNANLKRAGILQSTAWPMFYVSTVAAGLGLTLLILNAAPEPAPE